MGQCLLEMSDSELVELQQACFETVPTLAHCFPETCDKGTQTEGSADFSGDGSGDGEYINMRAHGEF